VSIVTPFINWINPPMKRVLLRKNSYPYAEAVVPEKNVQAQEEVYATVAELALQDATRKPLIEVRKEWVRITDRRYSLGEYELEIQDVEE
jgi:hypothetical protein